jgi:long-subunit fatty acid transport protein
MIMMMMGAAVITRLALPASASPIDDPHVGGIGWGGPSESDLTAVFWNPAALGLLQGTQVTATATLHSIRTTVLRTPIDPRTGAPGGDRAFPAAHGRGDLHPVSWPPGPGGFAAVGASIGKRFTLALAAYSPFVQRLSYDPAPGGQEPARYHLVEADLRSIALVPALALRIGDHLHFGVAPGFLFSVAHLVFDEDTALGGGSGASGLAADCGGQPCGAENPAAAARYDIASGVGPFDSSIAFTLATGLHWHRGRFAAGVAYTTRPLGNDAGGVVVRAPHSQVRAPLRTNAASACEGCAFGQVDYGLPGFFAAGVAWRVSQTIKLSSTVRYLLSSQHKQIRVRLTLPAPDRPDRPLAPEQVVLHRGFLDTVDVRLRASYQATHRVRVAVMLRAETSAVPATKLSPASVDGGLLEPAVAVEIRIGRQLSLSAGYALTLMPTLASGGSAFDPTAATQCADADGDLNRPACRLRLSGLGRPTADGTYSSTRHSASLGATFKF